MTKTKKTRERGRKGLEKPRVVLRERKERTQPTTVTRKKKQKEKRRTPRLGRPGKKNGNLYLLLLL